MKTIIIIPARWGSSRFPGKPFTDIGGKTMLQRVWEQTLKADFIDEVWIAVDETHMMSYIMEFGANVMLTGKEHRSGTERCGEVANKLELSPSDIVINVQGDEPFIDPSHITLLATSVSNFTPLVTLVTECEGKDLLDKNRVKTAINETDETITKFSRNYIKGKANYRHIGIYAYTVRMLKQITKSTYRPNKSNLEQVSWGVPIYYKLITYDGVSIDVPSDIKLAEAYMKRKGIK